MNQKETEKKRKQLRAEYKELSYNTNKLAWCINKARELGMSYGEFVTWLGV